MTNKITKMYSSLQATEKRVVTDSITKHLQELGINREERTIKYWLSEPDKIPQRLQEQVYSVFVKNLKGFIKSAVARLEDRIQASKQQLSELKSLIQDETK